MSIIDGVVLITLFIGEFLLEIFHVFINIPTVVDNVDNNDDIGDGVKLSIIGVDIESEMDNVCGSTYESELADDDNDVCNDVVSDEIDCGKRGLGGGGGGGGFLNNVPECDPGVDDDDDNCCCFCGKVLNELNVVVE
ncbi:hypothetical protein DERF_010466 [Dermatophagoides farinae]|uniref:Uncharacterized protein n=1 Tax=Dermatophagoides farinae TaxID=6954 RepID=A0A922HW67_DERFA|nr:hypothetical protein DERF_010466 [Dermatophagoides farinae]